MPAAKPLGFAFSHQAVLDPETGESVQITYTAPDGATAADLAAKMALVHEAVWLRIPAVNRRKIERSELVKAERQRRIADARMTKTKINETQLASEQCEIDTAMLRLGCEVAADEQLAQRVNGVDRGA